MKKIRVLILFSLLTVFMAITSPASWIQEEAYYNIAFEVYKATSPFTPDGIFTPGEYHKIAIDNTWRSSSCADDANDQTAFKLDYTLGLSWDDTYFYTYVQFTDPNGHDNTWGADPQKMWYSGTIQMNLADENQAGQNRLEYGIGLTSDSGEMISTIWGDYLSSGFSPVAGADYIVTVDGDVVTYECRTPISTFTNMKAVEGSVLSFCLVVSWGNGEDYCHSQFASGCTGILKDAGAFAKITLAKIPEELAVPSLEFTYDVLADSTAKITGFVGEAAGDLVIPNEIDGYTVTRIGEEAFRDCSGFTGKLVLPDSLTVIGESAFDGCSDLTGTLELPDSVTSIEKYAFQNCSSLTGNLVIPQSVTSIGKHAFDDCTGFDGNLVIPDSVTFIEKCVFQNCSGLTGNLVIPDSVTSIKDCAFQNCSGFTGNLVLPDGLTVIGDSAFDGCSGLTGNLVLPKNLTSIKNCAFQNCSGLTGNLEIPKTVTFIGRHAFENCTGLTGDLILPEGLLSVEGYAFKSCSGFDGNLVIPDSVTFIGEYSFYYCTGLVGTLDLPNGLISIGDCAFEACKGLTGDLIFPDSVKFIGGSSFCECTGFTGNLVLPEGLTTIEWWAFESCANLTGNLVLPDSLTSIGKYAFHKCSGFTGNLVIPEGVTSIGECAFYHCNGLGSNLVIPKSVTSIGSFAFEECSSIRKAYFYGDVPETWGVGETWKEGSVFLGNHKNFVLYYPEGNISGWKSPTWGAPDDTTLATATFNPAESLNLSELLYTLEYEGHVYYFYDLCMDWSSAVAYCKEMGGHLATVTSEEEWDMLRTAITDLETQFWLGGYGEGTVESWKWITGENWVYDNWCPDEPNNNEDEENYLGTYGADYQWNDYKAEKKMGFICEFEDGVESTDTVVYQGNRYYFYDPQMDWKIEFTTLWNGKIHLRNFNNDHIVDFVYASSGDIFTLYTKEFSVDGTYRIVMKLNSATNSMELIEPKNTLASLTVGRNRSE